MRKVVSILILALLVIGCSRTSTDKTYPAEEEERYLNRGQVAAAGNHLEQGKALYFKAKYAQASKHLTRSISSDFKNWEAHYFLGLCQQKRERYDRAIGSFNNALKYCPSDKAVIARISYHLGFCWEEEGYLHKASEKYSYALKLNPQMRAAKAGINRVKAKTEKVEKEKKIKNKEAL